MAEIKSCFICHEEWDKKTIMEKLQLLNINEENNDEYIENLLNFESFLKGPAYTCKVPNCAINICEPCFNKINETIIEDDDEKNLEKSIIFKCPFCRQPDWKIQMDGILFYVKLEVNKRMGTEKEFIENYAKYISDEATKPI